MSHLLLIREQYNHNFYHRYYDILELILIIYPSALTNQEYLYCYPVLAKT